MRVLVAEDDGKIAAFIVSGLKQAGFAVNHAADGENGLHLATTESLRCGRHRHHVAQAGWLKPNRAPPTEKDQHPRHYPQRQTFRQSSG